MSVWSRNALRRVAVFQRHGIAATGSGRQLWQRAARRGYASATGETVKKAGSDLPWLIGALAVTIPSCAYLLQPSSKEHGHDGGHGHGGGHTAAEHEGEDNEHDGEDNEQEGEDNEHQAKDTEQEAEDTEHNENAEKGEQAEAEGEDTETKEEVTEGEGEEKPEAGQSEGDNDKPKVSKDEGKVVGPKSREAQNQDEKKVVDSGKDVEGVRFKGSTNQGDEDNKMGDTRKHIPDPKGGAKKRIESHYGNRLGADTDDSEPVRTGEKAAASKKPGDQNTTSGKQAGLSNTDTKHSTDITKDPEKSKKGEGVPETAKLQGPVDPRRPQPESEPKTKS